MRVVPAGDFNYELRGGGYSLIRRPEPRFALKIRDAFGDSTSLINVGAGTGSYEPSDMSVTPIEPSETMREEHRSVERLHDALEDGSRDIRFGALRTASEYSGALRLLVANPE